MRNASLTARIIWICHAPTRAMRTGAFPTPQDDLDGPGLKKARAASHPGLRGAMTLTSPAAAAQQTAAAMTLDAEIEPALRDIDYGLWAGRSLDVVHAAEPERLAAWVADASRTTPGGEPFTDVIARVGSWMNGQRQSTRPVLAVTHSATIRAAIAVALRCPADSVFNIDIAPLSQTTMSFNGKWRLQALR
jgi:broad specificity phosphatase PhoE